MFRLFICAPLDGWIGLPGIQLDIDVTLVSTASGDTVLAKDIHINPVVRAKDGALVSLPEPSNVSLKSTRTEDGSFHFVVTLPALPEGAYEIYLEVTTEGTQPTKLGPLKYESRRAIM